MTLKNIFDLQSNGALKIHQEDGADVATMAGSTKVTSEQAEKLCKTLGWKEHYISAFDAIAKANNFVNTLRKSELTKLPTEVLMNSTIEFQNKRATTYGKTFDRVVIYIKQDKYTIIHGMENIGASYVVYVNGSSIASAKCRTLGKVAEYLVSVV